MRISTFRLVALVLTVIPAIGRAQVFTVGKDGERDRSGPRRSPVMGGLSVSYGQPVGDFKDNVKQGFGIDGNVHYKVDRQGIFSLGLEGGFLTYGRETKRVPLSSTIGGRILVDLTTSNNIVWAGIGPQLMAPSGPIRPYVNATAGFAYFFTESSVEGTRSDVEFAKTTNYDDGTFAWTSGGGFLIPVGGRRSNAARDIGATYHGNGNVKYLRKGGIVDREDGGVDFFVNQTKAPLLSWRVGFRVGIP
jgi:hypothetical protein